MPSRGGGDPLPTRRWRNRGKKKYTLCGSVGGVGVAAQRGVLATDAALGHHVRRPFSVRFEVWAACGTRSFRFSGCFFKKVQSVTHGSDLLSSTAKKVKFDDGLFFLCAFNTKKEESVHL